MKIISGDALFLFEAENPKAKFQRELEQLRKAGIELSSVAVTQETFDELIVPGNTYGLRPDGRDVLFCGVRLLVLKKDLK